MKMKMKMRDPLRSMVIPLSQHQGEDQSLVQPARRKEPAEEKRDLATGDEDLLPSKTATSCTSAKKEEDHQYGKTQLLHWNSSYRQDSGEPAEDTSI